MPITYGPSVISDFGAARLRKPGEKCSGDVMPGVYRAPEIIVGAQWGSKVDIWCIGVMAVAFFALSKMAVLTTNSTLPRWSFFLVLQPKEFLEMSEKCRHDWDVDGCWIASTPILDRSIESHETRLEVKEKELLVALARKILR
ncbi:protein kinase [Grosmannia clavigera kw1407]|uniref:Protein kinase n=1 Tax=Grosmannia clavigera (strain kw1407 / UAMH 11150) TaxID=655863 RepID=F0XEW9_GROCL|nr:protein kinase [Grosmannia clavigera kw1407]EFX03888.1 protein kinase [Grosmannia clavigera kw1407]